MPSEKINVSSYTVTLLTPNRLGIHWSGVKIKAITYSHRQVTLTTSLHILIGVVQCLSSTYGVLTKTGGCHLKWPVRP